jgi:tRNA dimethylallyltransferase
VKVLTIVGPTGVGKTEVSFLLAKRHNLEIISADSRQIYQGMDIGTAKPSKEMQKEVRFHLIDIIPPDKVFNAQDFALRAQKIMDRLSGEGKGFLICGGSGLYIKAIFNPLARIPRVSPEIRAELKKRNLTDLYSELTLCDPVAAQKIHPRDRQRIIRALEVFYQTKRPLSSFFQEKGEEPAYEPFYIGLYLPRKLLYKRIEERLERMIREGFIEEVKRLLSSGYSPDLYAFNALGYKEMMRYLKGEMSLEEAIRIGKKKIKEYARRQLTWFKREVSFWLLNYETEKTVSEIERVFPFAE